LDLPGRVTVEALPGKLFTGRVARIAPMPDPNSMFQNPDMKVYNTDVHLDGDGSGLRTGMSCRVEVIVDYYAEALYVPVQAVVRVLGKPTAWVKTAEGFKPRDVEIGLDNNRFVRIISGLEEGEEVQLSPPLAEAAATQQEIGMPAGGIPAPTTRPVGVPGGNRTGGMRRGGGEGFEGPGGFDRQGGQGGERGFGGQGRGEGGEGAAGGRGRGRGNFQNMTPEQIEAMRANMTPEQRQQMEEFQRLTPEEREQRMRSRGGAGGAGRRGGPGGAGGPGARGGANDGPPSNP
jgi:HlyD family secretion protein